MIVVLEVHCFVNNEWCSFIQFAPLGQRIESLENHYGAVVEIQARHEVEVMDRDARILGREGK